MSGMAPPPPAPHTSDTIGIAGREGAAPTADIEKGDTVWGAEGVHQPLDEAGGIPDCRSGPGTHAEGDCHRPMPFCDPAHRRGYQVHCFIPADAFPTGVRVALWTGAAKRMGQPLR